MKNVYISKGDIALLEEELLMKKGRGGRLAKSPKTPKGKKKGVKSKPRRKKAMKTVELPGMQVVHTVVHTFRIAYPDGAVEEYPPPSPPEKKAEEEVGEKG